MNTYPLIGPQSLLQTPTHSHTPLKALPFIISLSFHKLLPSSDVAPLTEVAGKPFIHSLRRFLWRPFKSSATERRSRLQHGYCIGVSRRSAQATAGKGIAQGPYVTTRAGVEPTTLRLKVIDSTKAPSRPTNLISS